MSQSYGSYDPYGQQQQNNGYPPQQGHQNPYADVEQGYEMQQQQQPVDPNTLLNEVREINDGIRTLKAKREGQLAVAQNALLESNTGREDQSARGYLEEIERELNDGFYKLKDDLRKIKNTKGSDNVHSQIAVTGRNLGAEIEQYQKSQSEFTKRLKEQVRRRYQIANPEASPDEVDQGVESVLAGTEQSFQVAGARNKRANDVRQATQERSAAIRKIEQDMIEVGRLVQEIAELVQQQEPAVQQINQGAENVAHDLQNANTQLGQAVVSARKARRWKWYALIIVVIIIAIIVAVAVGVTQSK
ncbi:t-SNARE [Aspergillus cavernicola]|uniref:t-SNARE n=1 Tax=Aspergillus cavernicola TaxID=176166 RepID=A0ABR4I939_9EURO